MNSLSVLLSLACLAGSAWTFDLIAIPAGSFTMGAAGYAEPEHTVTLTHDFSLSEKEITNEDFLPVLQWAYDHGHATVEGDWVRGYGQNLLLLDVSPYDFTELRFNSQTGLFFLTEGTGTYANWGPVGGYDPTQRPANFLTWYGAAAFCDWLSLMNGLEPFYQGDWSNSASHDPYQATGYRLPTEAEWEYAASYGGDRAFPWGETVPDCGMANIRPVYPVYCEGWPVAVGSYPEGVSALGLHDLAGNINEWVNDWSAPYGSMAQVNPRGAVNGTTKILRGGSWGSRLETPEMHTAWRRFQDPATNTGTPWCAGSFGFRIAQLKESPTSDAREIPKVFRLLAPYPNPFNPATTIATRRRPSR